MTQVLITGGAGFIGSHLTESLLAANHKVVCLDNFVSGSRENIAAFIKNPNFSLIEHDLSTPLPASILSLPFELILHFACPASPNPNSPVSYMSHPLETMMVCSIGTKQLLELAKLNQAQIILASTSEVYGDPEVHPQNEQYRGNVNTLGPRSCYDEGKRFLEALSMVYHREYGVKTKIIRIFNTYGPRMRLDDGRFTINLINSYLSQTPFKMHGEMASLTRSFCYISDLISAIIAVIKSDQMIGEVVNLGNPTELTLLEALNIFERVANTTLPKVQVGSQSDDPRRRCPDITKAKTLLGWIPTISFEQGIKQSLNYYQSKKNIT